MNVALDFDMAVTDHTERWTETRKRFLWNQELEIMQNVTFPIRMEQNWNSSFFKM